MALRLSVHTGRSGFLGPGVPITVADDSERQRAAGFKFTCRMADDARLLRGPGPGWNSAIIELRIDSGTGADATVTVGRPGPPEQARAEHQTPCICGDTATPLAAAPTGNPHRPDAKHCNVANVGVGARNIAEIWKFRLFVGLKNYLRLLIE